jgi:hypothetical protein
VSICDGDGSLMLIDHSIPAVSVLAPVGPLPRPPLRKECPAWGLWQSKVM